MFEIADRVRGWLAEGRSPQLARVVKVQGMSSRWTGEAFAAIGGELPAGQLLGGTADTQLAPFLHSGEGARLLDLVIGDDAAAAAGLACGGRAQVLLQPAADIADEAWSLLAAREPICLVTDLGGERIGRTSWFTTGPSQAREAAGQEIVRWFGRGASEVSILQGAADQPLLVSALWPAPRLLIVGDGLLAAALTRAAELLDWIPQTTDQALAAIETISGLTRGDAVVVLTHDRETDGPVLEAALAGCAGYVGALGSRRTQAARASWLVDRGVPAEAISEIRGPAGLDIGARTPAEIALAILAEILSVRTGRSDSAGGHSLRDRSGPIHVDGLNTPPARYEQRR